jgi:hypothetical protein
MDSVDFSDIDARIVTAICLCLIGLIVTCFTVKVWWTHPVNRAFLFGPYLTQEGLRVILRGWPLLFLLGALALAGGFSRFVYWLRWQGASVDDLAGMAGLIEAGLSLWAAGAMVIFTVRTWLAWRRR